MSKFDWSEAKRFWEVRDSYWAETDHDDDPDALQNVVCAGEPLWLNRAFARYQEAAYQRLFGLLPPPTAGARALDVGCGAGRWCRFLSNHGYHTVGIDLQPELIRASRQRYPYIDFFCTPVQNFVTEEPFDLVSSVTVIQHNPFEEQRAVIGKIRDLLNDGGHLIMLEGIRETPEPYYFTRSVGGWVETFESFGFRNVAIQRYNYNLLLRLGWRLTSMLRSLRPNSNELGLEEMAATPEPQGGYLLNSAKRLAVRLDTAVEPILARRSVDISSLNCGFLFQAV